MPQLRYSTPADLTTVVAYKDSTVTDFHVGIRALTFDLSKSSDFRSDAFRAGSEDGVSAMKSSAKYAAHPVEADRFVESDRCDRQERDAYLIAILRALDERIARISSKIAGLPQARTVRHRAISAERRELSGRLSDLQSARQDLVDVVFRSQ